MNTPQAYITQANTKIGSLERFLSFYQGRIMAIKDEKKDISDQEIKRIEKNLLELQGRLEEYTRLIQELQDILSPEEQADHFTQIKSTLNQAWSKVGYAETKLRAKLRSLPS